MVKMLLDEDFDVIYLDFGDWLWGVADLFSENSDQSLTLSESKQRKRTSGGWSSSSSPAATPSPKITAVGRV